MNQQTIRYRQYDQHFDKLDQLPITWSLEKYGCGPTSIANILSNYGYNYSPQDIANRILFDKSNNFDVTYLRKKGIAPQGLIYCLDRLIQEDRIPISYEIVKINFSRPSLQKPHIDNLLRAGHMAIIHVGPSNNGPQTFSLYGHYLVISSIDNNTSYHVINSNHIGDSQVNTTFSYDTILQNILGRKNSFNFLFIKKITSSAC